MTRLSRGNTRTSTTTRTSLTREKTRPRPGRGGNVSAPARATLVAVDTAEQTIQYIAELTEQLTSLAGGIREDSLAYFLSMAKAEAELAMLRRTQEP